MTPNDALTRSRFRYGNTRVGTLDLSHTEDRLLIGVASGKNRVIYLWGHRNT
jgi:hypothetical protein